MTEDGGLTWQRLPLSPHNTANGNGEARVRVLINSCQMQVRDQKMKARELQKDESNEPNREMWD